MQIDQFKNKLREHESNCQLIETPCGDGLMPFRIWQPPGDESITGEVLVMLHGGSGSWTHWIRNITALSTYYEVIVPDLPGLGDAARLPEGYQPEDATACVAEGINEILGDRRYHIAAFSWGCAIASLLAGQQKKRIKSQLLIGPASLGELPRRSNMKPLIPRTSEMSQEEIYAANRENLARLMIYDRSRIDDFAVYLQTENTDRARFRSPNFALGTYVLDGISEATAPLLVMFGEYDAASYPNIDLREEKLREVRPDVNFEVIPDSGHWMQYETADVFNSRCVAWIEGNIFR